MPVVPGVASLPDHIVLVWEYPGASKDEIESLTLSIQEALDEQQTTVEIGAAVAGNFQPPAVEVIVYGSELTEILDMVSRVSLVAGLAGSMHRHKQELASAGSA
jgi:hypothetical protein